VEIFSANQNDLFIKNLNFFSVVQDNSVIQLDFFLSEIYNLRSIMSVSLRFSYRIYPRALINIRKFYSHAFPKRNVMAYFAGQNSKSECIALKICTVIFSGFLITNLISEKN
jgi:hypothetical protein